MQLTSFPNQKYVTQTIAKWGNNKLFRFFSQMKCNRNLRTGCVSCTPFLLRDIPQVPAIVIMLHFKYSSWFMTSLHSMESSIKRYFGAIPPDDGIFQYIILGSAGAVGTSRYIFHCFTEVKCLSQPTCFNTEYQYRNAGKLH
jgi:hypothetical protein